MDPTHDASRSTSDSSPEDVISTGQFARPGRILVVDDSGAYRLLLTRILEQENHEIRQEENGARAEEAALEFEPDLILLDYGLPNMDGLQVCRRLKSHPSIRHVPIMMITAHSETKIQSTALDAGANDFLVKDADKVVLLARVRGMLKYRRALDALRSAQRQLAQRVETQAEDLAHVNRELNRRVEELEELQASARKTNEELDHLLAEIPSILIGIDADDRVTHWNWVARASFGVPMEKALGRPLLECGIDWDEAEVMAAVSACRSGRVAVRANRTRFKRISGEEGILGLNIAPIRRTGRAGTGVLIFGQYGDKRGIGSAFPDHITQHIGKPECHNERLGKYTGPEEPREKDVPDKPQNTACGSSGTYYAC